MSDSDKERLLGQPWDNEDFESTTPILDKRKRRGLNVWVVFSTVIAIVVSLLSIIDLQRKSQRPFATPEEPPREVCEHSTARPSWHELPLHRRRGYVHAVQRLSTLPSRLGLNTSLYDDFTYVHTQLVWQVHHVAMSLPFHRYFLYLFEQTLQLQGGYDGPIPYWDWTLDAGNPLSSPMWDPVAAFGGNGSGPDNCVEAGVFNRIGKVSNYTEDGFRPHCVARVFNSTPEDGVMHSVHWKDDVVQKILRTSNTYAELREKIENGPHRHVHRGIGGEMPKPSSTNGKSYHGTRFAAANIGNRSCILSPPRSN